VECRREQRRLWIKNNPDRIRASNAKYQRKNSDKTRSRRLTNEYGITKEQFDEMAEAHGFACLICGQRPVLLSVDHCHVTGIVRGLLCDPCNNGLSRFRDNTSVMRNAILYLEKFK
jgi:hypothetical protein